MPPPTVLAATAQDASTPASWVFCEVCFTRPVWMLCPGGYGRPAQAKPMENLRVKTREPACVGCRRMASGRWLGLGGAGDGGRLGR